MTSLTLNKVCSAVANNFSLKEISAEVHPGQLVGIIGPNGAGKSSLAKVIVGLKKLISGQILVNHTPLSTLNYRARAAQIAYLPQAAHFAWRMSVQEAVQLGRYRNDYRAPTSNDLQQSLGACGLTNLAHRDVMSLSGGEQMRVHLARVFYGQHPILVTDEPCASLDVVHQHRVMALLREHSREHVAIVIIHDLELAQRYCDRLLLLNDGRLMQDGDPRSVLGSSICADTFGVDFKTYLENPVADLPPLLIPHPRGK